MGKKKKFIDKKTATTFYLTYQNAEKDEEEVPAPRAAPGFPDDPELAEFMGMGSEYEDGQYSLTEARRREILSLGLPDDGYDYLAHLREVAPRPLAPAPARRPLIKEPEELAASSSAPVTSHAEPASAPSGAGMGPSMFIAAPKFVPPKEDARLVDARALHIAGQVEEEEEADAATFTVSAFTRSVALEGGKPGGQQPADLASAARSVGLRGRVVTELGELEESMRLLERDDDDDAADQEALAALLEEEEEDEEGEGHREAVQSQVKVKGDEEWADWLDEFVVMASALNPDEAAGAAGAAGAGEEEEEGGDSQDPDEDEEDEDEEGGDRLGSLMGSRPAAARRTASSIASSALRADRTDRKGELQTLDEHFDRLALQYEDDDLGDLEEGDGSRAAAARGTADITAFSSVLDQFLEENKALTLESLQGQGDEEGDEEDAPELVDEDECDDAYDSDMDEAEYEARMARRTQRLEGDIAGQGAARRMATLDERDDDVIQATRARLEAAAGPLAEDAAREGVIGADADQALPDALGTVVVDKGERWDCESVLSLRSNLENHPGRLVEPQRRAGGKGGGHITLSNKTGMPLFRDQKGGVQEVIPEEGQDEEEDSEELQGSGSEEEGGVMFERKKGETAEERKARKAAVKEAKRASRAAKKELKGMFKSEAQKQKKQAAGRAAAGGGTGMGNSTYVLI